MIAEKGGLEKQRTREFLDADIYQFNQFGRRPDLPKSLLDRSIWRATNLDETPLEFLLYLESHRVHERKDPRLPGMSQEPLP